MVRQSAKALIPVDGAASRADEDFLAMTWWVLIPFASVLISVAFAAGAATWHSERWATESVTRVFLCIGGWGLIDLFSVLGSDPERAGILTEMQRATWGEWLPGFSGLCLGIIALGTIRPIVSSVSVRQGLSLRGGGIVFFRSAAVRGGILLFLLTALTTDVFLPWARIPFPRLGALAAAIAAAGIWLHSLYRSGDLFLTSQGVARAVLQDLHEGVAFVMHDGTILSVNERLAALYGARSSALVGMPLRGLVDAPLDLILSGLQDREFRLRSVSGEQAPVALSSTFESDVDGGSSWIVVVFRDLRGVDALRRRLLTSGRLAAIGELAAGIAHEVNNPAAFIRSDLNFLRQRLAEIHDSLAKEDPIREAEIFEKGYVRIDRAAEGVERIVEVVGDVCGFSHLGGEGVSESNPANIVEGAVRLARLERREEVALHVAGTGDLRPVRSGQDLRQVLLALIRILTISSRVGGAVEIHLSQEEGGLYISLVADDLVQRANSQVHRIEMAREDVLETSMTDLGLAIAIELIDQLGGILHAEAQSEFAMSIDLIWPLLQEEDG